MQHFDKRHYAFFITYISIYLAKKENAGLQIISGMVKSIETFFKEKNHIKQTETIGQNNPALRRDLNYLIQKLNVS